MLSIRIDVLEIVKRGREPAIHIDLAVDGVKVGLYRIL